MKSIIGEISELFLAGFAFIVATVYVAFMVLIPAFLAYSYTKAFIQLVGG